MNPNEETLGEYLKRERELRRVSVEEIALWLNADRRHINALEENAFEIFARRLEAEQLLKLYATYLNLDQAEVSNRFGTQWKLTGGEKRHPKLTHFADGDPSAGRAVAFMRTRLLTGYRPGPRTRLALLVGVVVVGVVVFLYLPRTPQGKTPERPVPRDPGYAVSPAPPALDHAPPAAEKRNSGPTAVVAPGVSRPRPAAVEKPLPPPKNVRIVGNRDSKRYHLPGMKYYDKVRAYHRVIFQSEREAIRAGYTKARE